MEALYAIAGCVLGAVLVWLFAAGRVRRAERRAADADGRLGRLEATVDEVRGQNEGLSAQLQGVRSELDAARQDKVRAETSLAETRARAEEERKLLAEAKSQLTDTFKALAGSTLDSSSQAFLKMARGTFEKLLADAKGDLGKRQEAINGLVKPLGDALRTYEEHIRGLEKSRREAYVGLTEQLKHLSVAQQQLQKETGNLVTALRAPQVRGRWGEMTLRRAVELAGMVEHCDFTEQVTVQSDEGRLRPDMIVHLPAGREIVVDAKVPLVAYLDAVSADTEAEREEGLQRHVQQFRTHLGKLGAKNYWEQFDTAPDIAVMFVPGESFLAAAADRDHRLIEDGIEKKVVIATPTTLVALLRAVAYGWRQEQMAKNARAVSDLGRQLYERMRTLANHLNDMGKGLERANLAYNKAVGSMEARILPAARRFKDLGVGSGNDIAIVEPTETAPKELSAPELEEEP